MPRKIAAIFFLNLLINFLWFLRLHLLCSCIFFSALRNVVSFLLHNYLIRLPSIKVTWNTVSFIYSIFSHFSSPSSSSWYSYIFLYSPTSFRNFISFFILWFISSNSFILTEKTYFLLLSLYQEHSWKYYLIVSLWFLSVFWISACWLLGIYWH